MAAYKYIKKAAPQFAGVSVSAAAFEEMKLCAKDPIYFIKKYVKIRTVKHGVVRFIPYQAQEEFLRSVHSNRFVISNKSRQIGITTAIAAYLLWSAWFHRNQSILIVARQKEMASSIIRMMKVMIDHLPNFIKSINTFDVENKFSLEFSNKSRIVAAPKASSVGRSESPNILYCDETAHIEGFDEMWTALKPALSTGGSAILTSSPNGTANKFYEICKDAKNSPGEHLPGINDFVYWELPWYVRPDYTKEWFAKETKGMSNKEIRQEYLCQFLGSGDTVLDGDTLLRINEEVKACSHRSDTMYPMIKIYREYDSTKQYLITGDTSRGDDADFTGFIAWEISSAENVVEAATFKDKLPYDKSTVILKRMYDIYQAPLVAVESNFLGVVVIGELIKLGCDNIYYSMTKDDVKTYSGKTVEEQMKKVPGFTTSSKSRDIAISIWERMFREGKMHISSDITFDEFSSFIWKRSALSVKAQAQNGSNDDLVICSVIAAYIIGLEYDKILSGLSDLRILCDSIVTERTSTTGKVTSSAFGGEKMGIIEKDNILTDNTNPNLDGVFFGGKDDSKLSGIRNAFKQQKDLEKFFGAEMFRG